MLERTHCLHTADKQIENKILNIKFVLNCKKMNNASCSGTKFA